MKLYCQYSGVNFSLPHLQTARVSTLTVHPVFHMNRAQLYHLYADWQEGLMPDQTDQRLLFLALLNSTDLIDWQATANPSVAVVTSQMSNVYYTCKWVTAVSLPDMKLPRFAVANDTRRLDNVGEWMKVWEQIRCDFEAGYKTMSQLERRREREAFLERLIRSPGETSRFAGLLATWAFDAANVPLGVQDYWRQVLCSKGIATLSIRQVDIDEMVEHFEDALGDHGSIYSYTLLKYVRDLQKQVSTGLGYKTEGNRNLVDVVTRSEFTILDGDDITNTEMLNVMKLINAAPDNEPVETDYASKVAYLRAKISWRMASRSKEVKAEMEDKMAQKEADLVRSLLEDTILNIEAEDGDNTDNINLGDI